MFLMTWLLRNIDLIEFYPSPWGLATDESLWQEVTGVLYPLSQLVCNFESNNLLFAKPNGREIKALCLIYICFYVQSSK